MRFVHEKLLDAADATQATQTSSAIDCSYVVAVSIMAVAAGNTITGTLKVQASNDLPTTGAPTNWVDISSQTVSITGAGVFLIPKFDVSYQYLRVIYTKTTSASGALITAVIKTIGF